MPVRLADPQGGWRNFCEDPDRLDRSLRDLLDAGAPLFMSSRFSSPTGENARISAINSLFEGARILRRQSGIDVCDALPARAELNMRLKNAPVTRSKRLRPGEDIQHRFVEIDLRPAAPVVVLMATGTGRIAAEGFVQPFTQRAATLIWNRRPAILVTKRWDRTNRNDDLVGPLVLALQEHASWVCTENLFRAMDEETRLLLLIDSYKARSSTDDSDQAKRLGQADGTGHRLVDGQVEYHLPFPPAPGMGLATMRRRPNVKKECVAYLDMPGCRPAPDRVADGLSEVRTADGEVVDQVANVRFFLSRYGDPDWMDGGRIFKELARRRYSSVNLRRRYGPSAFMTSSRGYTAWQSILDNLEVYEEGVLRRAVGGDVPDVEIRDVVPPDGPWATPADFARIHKWLSKGQQRAGKSVRLSLSGLRATYDGVPCRTRSVGSPSTAHHDDPCLSFRRLDDPGRERRVKQHVLLPHRALAESLADAIIEAGAQALAPLLASAAAADDAADTDDAARLDQLDLDITELERQRDGLLSQLGETDLDGQPILHGAFLLAAQQQFEQIVQVKLPQLEQRRAGLAERIKQSARLPAEEAAQPDLLPRLVASLRDPSDRTYNKMWRRIIGPLHFTTAPSAHPGKNSRLLTWHGAIRLDGGSHGLVAIPFQGRYEYRRVAPGKVRPRYVDRRDQYLAAMLAGVPYDEADLPARHANRPRVAEMLGVEVGHPIFECDDPTILGVATSLLLRRSPAPGTVRASEDSGLVRAVRRVHVEDRSARRWRTTFGTIATAFYDLAALDGRVMVAQVVERCDTTAGTVHTAFAELRRTESSWTSERKRGYLLAPCPGCGSHDRRPATIAEVAGLLCQNCWRDGDGVYWKPSIYSRYLA